MSVGHVSDTDTDTCRTRLINLLEVNAWSRKLFLIRGTYIEYVDHQPILENYWQSLSGRIWAE
jgi:hypothetical protein